MVKHLRRGAALLLWVGVAIAAVPAAIPHGAVEIRVEYLDAEGREGVFRLVWNQRTEGFTVRAEPISPLRAWEPFTYEKERERRTVRKGYDRWLAPHHLSTLIGETPFRLGDIETIDRWIRDRSDGVPPGDTAWAQRRRGEGWWKASLVTSPEEKSPGGSNSKRIGESNRSGR